MRYTAAFEAIGVTNEVTVVDPDALPDALRIARAQVAAFDYACSRFRGDSELARLNASGSMRVSPLLLDAIHVALDAAAKSGGLVDPTVGRSLRSLGYDSDFQVVVRDTTPPAVSATANVTVNATSPSGATANGRASTPAGSVGASGRTPPSSGTRSSTGARAGTRRSGRLPSHFSACR